MGYDLQMNVKNSSGNVVLAYLVTHCWDDDQKSAISGKSLADGEVSAAQQIHSGSGGRDKYSVLVQFVGDHDDFATDFYCNASSDQDAVQIVINDGNCDSVYYKAGKVDDGCYNKG